MSEQREQQLHPKLVPIQAADSTPKLAVALERLNGELRFDGKGLPDLDVQQARDSILSKLGLARGKKASQYFAVCINRLMKKHRSPMQTSKVRDALVQLLKQENSAIESVADALRDLANDQAGAKLCSTREVHDAVCDSFADSFAKSESKIERRTLADLVSNIINNNPSPSHLFASDEIIKSLSSALHHENPDCRFVPKTITAIITRHPPARPSFATDKTRDGFLNAMTACSKDSTDASSLFDVICLLLDNNTSNNSNNQEARQLFCTPEFAASFYFMGVRCESLEACVTSGDKKKQETFLRTLKLLDPDYEAHIPQWQQERLQLVVGATTTEQLGRALKLVYRNRDDILLTEQVRDLLVSKIDLINDRETSKWFGKFLVWFANNNNVSEIKALVRTSQVRDAIVQVLSRSSNKNIDVAPILDAMCEIVFDSNESVQRYCTEEVRDAVCVGFENAATNEEFTLLFFNVAKLIDDYPSLVAQLYATARFRDCIVRALDHRCFDGFDFVAQLIQKLPRASQVHELFSTSEVCEGFVQVMKKIELDYDIKYFSNAIFAIINNNEKGQKIFLTDNQHFVDEFAKLEEWIDMEQAKTDKDGFLTSKGSFRRMEKLIHDLSHHWLYQLARKYSVTVPQQVIDILDEKNIGQTAFLLLTDFQLGTIGIPEDAFSTLRDINTRETAPPPTVSAAALQLLDRLRQEFPVELVYEPHEIEFDASSHLGQGSYGSVRSGSILLPLNERKRCAAKFFKNIEFGIKEANNYIGLDHPNVTQILGVTVSNHPTDPHFIILLELAERDFSKLLRSTSPPLSLQQIHRYALQIASGLAYLHNADENRGKKRILHLDLKPQNVVVFPGDVLKLIDFGSMKETDHTKTQTSEVLGTNCYLPPETLVAIEAKKNSTRANQGDLAPSTAQKIAVSPVIDVFAFGVILLQMMTHSSHAQPIVSSEQVANRILSGSTIECCVGDINCHSQEVAEGGKDVIELCKRCLMVRPSARPKNGEELVAQLEEVNSLPIRTALVVAHEQHHDDLSNQQLSLTTTNGASTCVSEQRWVDNANDGFGNLVRHP